MHECGYGPRPSGPVPLPYDRFTAEARERLAPVRDQKWPQFYVSCWGAFSGFLRAGPSDAECHACISLASLVFDNSPLARTNPGEVGPTERN